MKRKFLLNIGAASLGGVLLGVGSYVTVLWPLSLLAFAPILFVFMRVQKARSMFGLSFLAGCIAYGLSYGVLFDTLPLTWLGVDSHTIGFFVVGIAWFFVWFSFSIAFAFCITLAWKLRSTNILSNILILVCAYVFADWLGSWVFSLSHLAPGSFLGSHFTIASPAYQLAEDAFMVRAASWGGMYALAAVQALVGCVLGAAYLARNRRQRAAFIATLVCMVGGWLFVLYGFSGVPVKESASINVALVAKDANKEAGQQQGRFADILATHDLSSADLIALPEGADFLKEVRDMYGEQGAAQYLDTLGVEVPIFDATTVRENGALLGRIDYYDPQMSGFRYGYKTFLMPLGETQPYAHRAVLQLAGQGGLVDHLQDARGYSYVQNGGMRAEIRGTDVAVRLCSEAMSPTIYARDARNGANVLLNLSSHAWFNNSYRLHILTQRVSRVRATETGLYYARSGGSSPAYIINPEGRVIAETAWGKDDVLTGAVYALSADTVYVRFGQWVLLIPLILLCVVFVVRVRSRQKTQG